MTKGNKTASYSTSFAFSSSAMSSNVMSGLNEITSFSSISIRFESGPFPSGQQDFRKFLRYYSAGLALGFLALRVQGLLQSLPPLFTPLLLLATGVGLLGLVEVVFLLSTGFFFGQIYCSLSSNYLSRCSFSLCSRSRQALSASRDSFSLRLYNSSSSCEGCWTGFLAKLGWALSLLSSWLSSLYPFISLTSLSECSSLALGRSLRCSLAGMFPLRISNMSLAIFFSLVSTSSMCFHSVIKFLSLMEGSQAVILLTVSVKKVMASVYLPRRALLRARTTSVLMASSTFDIRLLLQFGSQPSNKSRELLTNFDMLIFYSGLNIWLDEGRLLAVILMGIFDNNQLVRVEAERRGVEVAQQLQAEIGSNWWSYAMDGVMVFQKRGIDGGTYASIMIQSHPNAFPNHSLPIQTFLFLPPSIWVFLNIYKPLFMLIMYPTYLTDQKEKLAGLISLNRLRMGWLDGFSVIYFLVRKRVSGKVLNEVDLHHIRNLSPLSSAERGEAVSSSFLCPYILQMSLFLKDSERNVDLLLSDELNRIKSSLIFYQTTSNCPLWHEEGSPCVPIQEEGGKVKQGGVGELGGRNCGGSYRRESSTTR